MLADIPEAVEIPLKLSSQVLARCSVYFHKHGEHEGNNGGYQPNNIDDDVKAFDAAFFNDMTPQMVVKILEVRYSWSSRHAGLGLCST